jgi:AraC-like DNA-binding protein
VLISDLESPVVPQKTILRSRTANGFGIYHDLVGVSGSTVSRYGDVFSSAVTAFSFADFTMFDRQLVGVEHCRDKARIGRDGFEHFYLQVLRSGRMLAGPLGEERPVLPGDAILFDATRPQRSRVANADYVTIVLARDQIEALAPHARSLHGRILPRSPESSIGEIALSLARRAPTSSRRGGGALVIAGHLARIAGVPIDRSTVDQTALDATRRLQAEIFIDNHLEHALTVASIARGIGVSRSALYRAFRECDGIEALIINRRAARLRSMIFHRKITTPLEVLSNEAGFATAGHGSRVFRQVYGLPPSQLRTQLRLDQRATVSDLEVRRMDEWYRALNS